VPVISLLDTSIRLFSICGGWSDYPFQLKERIMAKKKTISRSSKTGKFVKKSYAATHPSTTENQRVRVGRKRGR
jgi:hypothetical protein